MTVVATTASDAAVRTATGEAVPRRRRRRLGLELSLEAAEGGWRRWHMVETWWQRRQAAATGAERDGGAVVATAGAAEAAAPTPSASAERRTWLRKVPPRRFCRPKAAEPPISGASTLA
eukprot:3493039-Prymnesium_polylepis.1